MAGTPPESESVPVSRFPLHTLVKVGAFAGLLFLVTFVNWSFPGIYGRGPALFFILLTLATFMGLCLPLGAGCLAAFLYVCSLAALRVYEGYPAHVIYQMFWGSMRLMGFLLVVHAGRWIARLLERAWSIDKAARSVDSPSDDDAEPSGARS